MFKKIDNILDEICRHEDKGIEERVMGKKLKIYDSIKKVIQIGCLKIVFCYQAITRR